MHRAKQPHTTEYRQHRDVTAGKHIGYTTPRSREHLRAQNSILRKLQVQIVVSVPERNDADEGRIKNPQQKKTIGVLMTGVLRHSECAVSIPATDSPITAAVSTAVTRNRRYCLARWRDG